MNLFASLEDILAPIGEPKSPVVGLMVEDWDENLGAAAGQLVDEGYAVKIMDHGQVLPMGKPSQEQNASDNGIVPDNEIPHDPEPQVLFYYKGVPEDASQGIPILVAEDGKVQVSHEGQMSELRDYLRTVHGKGSDGDHEYR